MIQRRKSKKIYVGNVAVGGDASISVQSMTYTKTEDVEGTLDQIRKLHFAGADIVRVTVPREDTVEAMREICKQSPLPIIADIHFKHKIAIAVAPFVDCIRINPGNIGSREKVKEVVKACKEYNIPIRIGVNSGSIERQFENKYGQSVEAMVQSAMYNIKYLEDLDFTNLKVSIKASDVSRTVEAYTQLASLHEYPLHLGVTEAGTLFQSSIKSSVALGHLLMQGIGDTMRISITGALEDEIKVGRGILKSIGLIEDGLNIISCPTCGRLESNLVDAVALVEEKTKHIKSPLHLSILGCVVNAIGEAKSADVGIAFGKGSGMIIKKGVVVARLKEADLIDRFLEEVKKADEEYQANLPK